MSSNCLRNIVQSVSAFIWWSGNYFWSDKWDGCCMGLLENLWHCSDDTFYMGPLVTEVISAWYTSSQATFTMNTIWRGDIVGSCPASMVLSTTTSHWLCSKIRHTFRLPESNKIWRSIWPLKKVLTYSVKIFATQQAASLFWRILHCCLPVPQFLFSQFWIWFFK